MKTIHHVVDIDAPVAQRGTVVRWTFAGDVNPVMEAVDLDEPSLLVWRCVDGHDPWRDSTFRFETATLDDGRSRVRFWQEYAVELADDHYGTYNVNWGYYLESLRLLCATGSGTPFRSDA